VFSPYYARALRQGPARAENHAAINVALYGRGGHHWAMTERGQGALARTADSYRLGPSSLEWDGRGLTIRIQERTSPYGLPLRGTIRLDAGALLSQRYPLDAAGRHHWQPLQPAARVSVAVDQPGQSWEGHGYFDMNDGTRPLIADFQSWDWARGLTRQGPVLLYDVTRLDGSSQHLALRMGPDGRLQDFEPPPLARLGTTPWRMPRQTRCASNQRPRVLMTLEDTPFYARSVIASHLAGEDVTLMHESVSLANLQKRWVETLMPFRMPRRA
jgi:carotenoid 1,2-hydratase